MDLKKLSNEDKLNLCKKYFFGGLAFLPFLWFVNIIWFFREAFIREPFEEQPKIKTYLIWSMVGLTLSMIIIMTWFAVFQTHRVEWGATADYMSFIIPRGIP